MPVTGLRKLELGEWLLRVDVAKTQELYASLPQLTCGCGNCNNLIAAYEQLPSDVKGVFDRLGIDPRRDGGEVYAFMHHDDGATMYSGVMLFVGEIEEEPAEGFVKDLGGGSLSFNETKFADTLEGGFKAEDSLVRIYVPEPPTPHAVFQFTLDKVPWVLRGTPEP